MSPPAAVPALLLFALFAPGEIAFTRGGDVHVVGDAGGAERALTTDLDYDRPILFSPGGETLVYWKHDAGWNLWAVDASGKGPHRNLTGQTGGDCRSAAFTRDGKTIVYMRGEPQGVYAMAADGSAQRLVIGEGHRDQPPSPSPDGKSVAYMDLVTAGENSVRAEVRAVQLDGANDRLVATGDDPQWTPDGKSIVFVGHGAGGRDLFRAPAEGGGKAVPVAASPDDESEPRLSPDGSRVAYNSRRADETSELRVIALGGPGAEATTVARIEGRAEPPSWSPDGTRLAFVSGGALYVVAASGSGGPVRIAEGGVHWPAWRPEPAQTGATGARKDR